MTTNTNAALIAALEDAQAAINSMKVEAETAAQGDEQMMLEACEQISNEGLEASEAIRAALERYATLVAAQAHEAAPAAQGEPSDPLQGAANWLLEAINGCNISTLQSHLKIGFNRAERLMLAARAAQQKGASNG